MRRSLSGAFLLSAAVHLAALFWPGVEVSEAPEPPGEARRLEARFLPPPVLQEAPAATPAVIRRRVPKPAAASVKMPGTDPGLPAPPMASAPADHAPLAEASTPPEALAGADASGVPEAPVVTNAVAFLLPSQGRVIYSGSAGGVIGLQAYGETSWNHDGQTLRSRLAAGLNSTDSALDFQSVSRLSGPQIISESTDDQRMSKHSTSQIDQAGGLVHLQRGQDTREREIKGLAVALSALPQMLAMLDESIQKAAFFVVGDFWVEDALLIALGEEEQSLPVGRIMTRHYQSRTANDKLIDIWLAPAWKNAAARIRIRFDGYTVDLKAAQVEIDGHILVSEAGALPPSQQ